MDREGSEETYKYGGERERDGAPVVLTPLTERIEAEGKRTVTHRTTNNRKKEEYMEFTLEEETEEAKE